MAPRGPAHHYGFVSQLQVKLCVYRNHLGTQIAIEGAVSDEAVCELGYGREAANFALRSDSTVLTSPAPLQLVAGCM